MAFPEGYSLLNELRKHLPMLRKLEKQNTLMMQQPKIKKRKVVKDQTNQEG